MPNDLQNISNSTTVVEFIQKTNQILNQEELIKGDLSKREIDFILNKLKDATYKGLEFELFYTVWVKLTRLRKKG